MPIVERLTGDFDLAFQKFTHTVECQRGWVVDGALQWPRVCRPRRERDTKQELPLMRFVIFAISALAWAASASAGAPERRVADHTVYSSRGPRVDIRVPKDVDYVGSDAFTLSKPGLGDFDLCELYAFAKADKDGALNKLYWVHFERLLPNHPEMHMTYDSPRHATIGGWDFFVDTDFSDGASTPKPGSDTEHFYRLLAKHGYRRSPMMFVRLVHLTDAVARQEVMLIVGEALPSGVTSASLQEGGKDHARLPILEERLIASAVRSISIAAPPQ